MRLVLEWASRNKKVEEIWYNDGDMSDKRDTLFVITSGRFDSRLNDEMAGLELRAMREFNYDLKMQDWPCGRAGSREQGFKTRVYSA